MEQQIASQSNLLELRVRGEEGVRSLGHQLACFLCPGDVIAMSGDLGTGKTTLTKAIAEGLGVTELVTSPTFTIVHEYQGRLPLYHFDVYRVYDPDELYELGYEEYFYGQGVSVVEWADLIPDLIPDHALRVAIKYSEDPEERIYQISGLEGRDISCIS